MITNIATRRDVRNRVVELTEQNRALHDIDRKRLVMVHDYTRFLEKHLAKHGWIPGEGGAMIKSATAQSRINMHRNRLESLTEQMTRRCEYQDTLYAVLQEIDAGMPGEDAWKWLEEVWSYYNR